MNITRYMKAHESSVKKRLLSPGGIRQLTALKNHHDRVLAEMQHERLIHLLVTLAFAGFLLMAIAIVFIRPAVLVLVLATLFFVLLIPYIVHYYFLENTIQRWYLLADSIEKELSTLQTESNRQAESGDSSATAHS